MARDLYKALGVKKKASKEDIRTAFRKLAKETHSDTGGDDAAFIELKRAYDVLIDDKARDQYDRYGFIPGDKDAELTSQALTELKGLFIATIQSNSLEKIVQTDIVERMREVVRENIGKVEGQISEIAQKLLEPEKLKAELSRRLRCKAKLAPEVMLAAIDELIAPMSAQKAMLEAAVKVLHRCVELLEDYSFECDAPPPRSVRLALGHPHFGNHVFTTTSSW